MPNTRMKAVAVFLAALVSLAISVRDIRADEQQTELEKLNKELDAAKKRITELEENAVKLMAQLEEHRKLLLQAERAEKIARLAAEEQAKRFEERFAKLVKEGAIGEAKLPHNPPKPLPGTSAAK